MLTRHRRLIYPKLIYTVMLWYSFVVQSPPPGGGVTTLGGAGFDCCRGLCLKGLLFLHCCFMSDTLIGYLPAMIIGNVNFPVGHCCHIQWLPAKIRRVLKCLHVSFPKGGSPLSP